MSGTAKLGLRVKSLRHQSDSDEDGSSLEDSVGQFDQKFQRLRMGVLEPAYKTHQSKGSSLEEDLSRGSENLRNTSRSRNLNSGIDNVPSIRSKKPPQIQYRSSQADALVWHGKDLIIQEPEPGVTQNGPSDDEYDLLSVISGVKSTKTAVVEVGSVKMAKAHKNPTKAYSVADKENIYLPSNLPSRNRSPALLEDSPSSKTHQASKESRFISRCIAPKLEDFKAVSINPEPQPLAEGGRRSNSSHNTLSEYLEPTRSKFSQPTVQTYERREHNTLQEDEDLDTEVFAKLQSLDSRQAGLKLVQSSSAAIYPECMLEYVVPIILENPAAQHRREFQADEVLEEIGVHKDQILNSQFVTNPTANTKDLLFPAASGIHSSGEQSSFYSIKMNGRTGWGSVASKSSNKRPGLPRPFQPAPQQSPVERNIFHDWNSGSDAYHSKQTLASQLTAVEKNAQSVEPHQVLDQNQVLTMRAELLHQPKDTQPEQAPNKPGLKESDGTLSGDFVKTSTTIFLALSEELQQKVRKMQPRPAKQETPNGPAHLIPANMSVEEYSLSKLSTAMCKLTGLNDPTTPQLRKTLQETCKMLRDVYKIHTVGEHFLERSVRNIRRGMYDQALDLVCPQVKTRDSKRVLTDGRILPAEMILLVVISCANEYTLTEDSGRTPNTAREGDLRFQLIKLFWNACKAFKLATALKVAGTMLQQASSSSMSAMLTQKKAERHTNAQTPPKPKQKSLSLPATEQFEQIYSNLLSRPKCETRLSIILYIVTGVVKIYKNQLFVSQTVAGLRGSLFSCLSKLYVHLTETNKLSLLKKLGSSCHKTWKEVITSKIASVLAQTQNSFSCEGLKFASAGLHKQHRHRNLKKNYFGIDETKAVFDEQWSRINQAYSYTHETVREFLSRAPGQSFESLHVFVGALFVLLREISGDCETVYCSLWESMALAWRAEIFERVQIAVKGQNFLAHSAHVGQSTVQVPGVDIDDKSQQPKFRDWLELTLDNNLSLGVPIADIWKFVSCHCKLRKPLEPFESDRRKSNIEMVRESAISLMLYKLITLGRFVSHLRQHRTVQMLCQL